MPSGGHARSGPPPDPNALRRERDKAEWRTLPIEGRPGEAPAWPLSAIQPREAELWPIEWRRPQAVMWERNDQALEVALFVRAVVVAEAPKATAADRSVVLRHMDALGITQAGLRANRWRIAAEPEQVTRPDDPHRASAKTRLTAISGGVA